MRLGYLYMKRLNELYRLMVAMYKKANWNDDVVEGG